MCDANYGRIFSNNKNADSLFLFLLDVCPSMLNQLAVELALRLLLDFDVNSSDSASTIKLNGKINFKPEESFYCEQFTESVTDRLWDGREKSLRVFSVWV